MIGAHHPKGPARGWAGVALRWLAGLFVLGILFHFLPLAPLRSALARIPLTRFLAVLIGYLLAHTIGAAKWRMVINSAGAELDFATSAQCYFGGLFGTLFLPSIIGGDVVRLGVGLRRSPRPAAVLAGNIADRFVDACALAGLTLLGIALVPGSLPPELRARVWRVLGGLGVLAVAVFLVAMALYRPLLRGRPFRFRRKLARLRQSLREVSRRPHILLYSWLLGLFVQASLVLLTALLAISCGLPLPLRIWLFAWPLAKLAALLPLTQGGVGVREAALVALLAPFGAPGPLVLAAGLAWEGVSVAGALIAGLVSLLLRRAGKAPGEGIAQL